MVPAFDNPLFYAPVSQLAEEVDLKFIQCGFESHREYQIMCEQHQQEAIGSVCGINYCLVCADEYQEYLKTKNEYKAMNISWGYYHGKIRWKINGEPVTPPRT